MTHDEVDLPVIQPGTYLHTKSGHRYEVIGVALSTETNEAMVVYKPLWKSKHVLYVRPYAMFTEDVEIDGAVAPRFQKTDD